VLVLSIQYNKKVKCAPLIETHPNDTNESFPYALPNSLDLSTLTWLRAKTPHETSGISLYQTNHSFAVRRTKQVVGFGDL